MEASSEAMVDAAVSEAASVAASAEATEVALPLLQLLLHPVLVTAEETMVAGASPATFMRITFLRINR